MPCRSRIGCPPPCVADGRSVELAGTLKDLAAELGLTHEALYRTLAGPRRMR